MGYEQIDGMEDFHFVDFSAGYFPNKNRRDIPMGFYSSKRASKDLRNGFKDVQHCIWHEAALRKFFGYTAVPSAQVNSGGTGLGIGCADWLGELTQFGIFGTKFYEIASDGTATDRTAAITIDATEPYHLKTHIQGANHYIIGGNGYGGMIKWTGTGANIALLGGTPHNFKSFDYYGERWWGIRRDSNWNFLYGSDFTDPETNWNDSGVIFPFKDTLTGCVKTESWLAVVGQKTINSLSGFGEQSFEKDEAILPIGTTAHRSLCAGSLNDPNYGWVNGFYMLASSGPVFISENKKVYPLALPMQDLWNTSGTGLNKQYLHLASGVWLETLKMYVFAVPWGASNNPNYLFAIDASKPIQFQDKVTYPVWPMPNILSSSYNAVALSVMKDSASSEWLYMQDDNGWYYKFDPEEKNYYPNDTKTGIQAHAQSGSFDLGAEYEVRETQLYARSVGDWTIQVYLNFDSGTGSGSYDDVSMLADGDVLGSTFVLGASTMGGSSYVFELIDVNGTGQLFQFKFQDYDADQSFNIEELIVWMKFLRQRSLRC